ncbi:9530_t:CDS:2 [Funneliformis caledonium]|uniref:9530_t:CDS:1 n=1 Tax=Funneliformis caledonium TaxID=1117310 RepID=A0A9N9DMW0_9GLOM|nr:9530_t:CDS:2 [Funneliformis caledonium]
MLIIDVNNELPTIITSEIPVDSLAIPDFYGGIVNETCMQYVTSPQYIQVAYRGYFSLNDNSTLLTFPKLNAIRLNNLALTIVIDDPNFNTSKFDPSPPYAYIFDSENNPLKLSKSTLNLTILNVSQSTNNERNILFSNLFVMPNRMIFPLDVEEVQAEDYISIILVRPNSFVNVIETEQRSRTYVSIFGVIGGAWGLVSAFYVLGASLIHPWGFVQSRCYGIKQEIKDNIDDKINKLQLPEDITKEMKKLKYLLKEYVVDLQSIEK